MLAPRVEYIPVGNCGRRKKGHRKIWLVRGPLVVDAERLVSLPLVGLAYGGSTVKWCWRLACFRRVRVRGECPKTVANSPATKTAAVTIGTSATSSNTAVVTLQKVE
jgi:hypothetical protein